MKLAVKQRTRTGKDVKNLRKEGLVPAVVYGKHMDAPVHLAIDKVKLVKAYHKTGMSTPLHIEGDGMDYLVLFHELQLDPVSDHVIHVDFLAVNKDEKVHADVPVILEGVSPFEKSGLGKVQLVKSTISVEALPLELPHDIKIDISGITDVHDVIHISDIKLKGNVEILDDAELTLVTVSEFKQEVEEDDADDDGLGGAGMKEDEAEEATEE